MSHAVANLVKDCSLIDRISASTRGYLPFHASEWLKPYDRALHDVLIAPTSTAFRRMVEAMEEQLLHHTPAELEDIALPLLLIIEGNNAPHAIAALLKLDGSHDLYLLDSSHYYITRTLLEAYLERVEVHRVSLLLDRVTYTPVLYSLSDYFDYL